MHRTLMACLLTCVVSAPASAHDFWLEPEKFAVADPGRIEVIAKVGHADDVGEWPAEPARVLGLRLISSSGITDVQSELASRRSAGRFTLLLPEPGAHVLSLESTGAVSDLPASEFNAYVEEEGLTPIAEHRAAAGRMSDNGREVYSRRAKAILLAGPLNRDQCNPRVLEPIGLTLEVTPLVLPACLQPGSNLPIEVRYRGEPLAGATLHLVRLGSDAGDMGQWVTGEQGRVSLPYPGAGNWMLQSVWSAPLSGDQRGEYDTVFSSLSFSVGAEQP